MRTVLVTGANGQLGCRLVRRLLRSGYRVRGTILPAALDPRRPAETAGVRNVLTRPFGVARSLARTLRGRSHRPRTVADPLAGLDVELVTGDLRDPEFAAGALKGVDAVLHTANFVRTDAFENNVLATFNVAKGCADRAAEIQRIARTSWHIGAESEQRLSRCHDHGVHSHPRARRIVALELTRRSRIPVASRSE